MSAKNSCYATVKQEGPRKCPIMGEGDLNTKNAHQYDDYCNCYFDVKDIPEDKQVHKVIAGICDQQMKDHISTNHAHIITLTFPKFLKELRDNWLNKNWEATMRVQLLHMVQGQDQPFRDYVITLLAQNSLLMGTTSHLSNAKLHHQLEAGLELHLSQKIESNTVIAALNTNDFTGWNIEVKHVDDALCVETLHFEEIAVCNHNRSQHDYQIQNTIIYNHKNPSNNTTSFTHLPKLTDNEQTLLMDNHGCLKCHHLFEYHVLKDCTKDWPNATTYCTITAADVAAAGKAGKIRKNISAAMMSVTNPITSSSTVAAIISPNPVTYVATNMQSVIADDPDYSDSDDSNRVCVHCSSPCTAVVSSTKIPTSTVKQIGEKVGTALFFEPYLWWHCSMDVSDFMPQTINALIDPGSHADLVNTLLLCCHLLHKPKIIE